jgi:hypothetical protein
MMRPSIAPVMLAAAFLSLLAAYMVPRGIDVSAQLAISDNPAAIAERSIDEKFNTGLAEREIKLALVAKNADLAQSFVDLAPCRDCPGTDRISETCG